jgi:hypothetical protein
MRLLTAIITMAFGARTTGRNLEMLNPSVGAEHDLSSVAAEQTLAPDMKT